MDSRDRKVIESLNSIFAEKAPIKFEPEELDDEMWEEGLRLGYSDGVLVEAPLSKAFDELEEAVSSVELSPGKATPAFEELEEAVSSVELSPGKATPIRGIFEGVFIPTELG